MSTATTKRIEILDPHERVIWFGYVEADNPYDEGYLLTEGQAVEIAGAWRDRPIPADEHLVRQSALSDSGVIVLALCDQDGLSMDFWESTTDFHDWEDGSTEAVWSTKAFWPFEGTFTIREQP